MGKVITKDVPKTFTPIGQMLATEKLEFKDAQIIVPDTVEKTWETPVLRVIAVGPDCKWVKEGNYIIYPNGGAAGKIFFRGYQYYIVNENEIVGIIPDGMVLEILKDVKQQLSILAN
jgi:hypothetical protein